MLNQDETSLMQVQIGVHRREDPGNGSDASSDPFAILEAAQNDYKGNRSNASIARYAAAQAKQNMLLARYNAMTASFKTQGKDFASTNAGRAALRAVQAAESEAAAWKLASDAEDAAQNASLAATADHDGKQTALYNVTANAVAATNARQDAELAAKNARIQAQFSVDRAAASAAAQEAYELKTKAAAAVAAAKEADDKAYYSKQQAKLANKAANKAYMGALKNEFHAANSATDTQWASKEAAAAEVDQELTASASSGE